ncbi:serine hydrolase [Streptosporangium lutulentum]
MRQFENAVGGSTIWQRMSAYRTPGVAVAVVVGNKIAWSTGYGWLEAGGAAAAHPETAFQAASISKAVTAIGVLRLLRTRGIPYRRRPPASRLDPAEPFVRLAVGGADHRPAPDAPGASSGAAPPRPPGPAPASTPPAAASPGTGRPPPCRRCCRS